MFFPEKIAIEYSSVDATTTKMRTVAMESLEMLPHSFFSGIRHPSYNKQTKWLFK
jgi:hypothetical protein